MTLTAYTGKIPSIWAARLAMRGRLVAGNWKSNGDLASNQRLLEEVRAAARDVRGVECVVCVPYPYLFQSQQILAGAKKRWGCQVHAWAYRASVSCGFGGYAPVPMVADIAKRSVHDF